MSYGVMVTHWFLVPRFKVRVLVGLLIDERGGAFLPPNSKSCHAHF
jgi:hypothetical protein